MTSSHSGIAAMRPSARLLITFLAALSIVFAQLAGFAAQPADAAIPSGYSFTTTFAQSDIGGGPNESNECTYAATLISADFGATVTYTGNHDKSGSSSPTPNLSYDDVVLVKAGTHYDLYVGYSPPYATTSNQGISHITGCELSFPEDDPDPSADLEQICTEDYTLAIKIDLDRDGSDDTFTYKLNDDTGDTIDGNSVTVDELDVDDKIEVFADDDSLGDITVTEDSTCAPSDDPEPTADLKQICTEDYTLAIEIDLDRDGSDDTFTYKVNDDTAVTIDGNSVTVDDLDIDDKIEVFADEDSLGDITVTDDSDCADPQITKTASSSSTPRGGEFTYTIEVENKGSGTSTWTMLKDEIPEPFVIEDVEVTTGDSEDENGNCYPGGYQVAEVGDSQTVHCSIEPLETGESFIVVITVSVPSNASCAPTTNTAILYEDPYNGDGISVSSEEDLGTYTEIDRDSADVSITGCGGTTPRTGEVTVAKVVEGEDAPDDAEFSFTLDCGDGEEEFPLLDGESETFTGITAGSDCTVTETDDQEADLTTWETTGDAEGEGDGTEADEFTVGANDKVTVTFTNEFAAVEGEIFEPGISVVKDAIDGVTEEDGALVVTLEEGETGTVTYRSVVTNTGDEPLTDLTLVDDKIGDLTAALIAAVTAEFGDAELPVGASVTVDADHDVTIGDFDSAGELTNVVEVIGTGVESGGTVDDSDDETIELVAVLGEVEEVDDEAEELPKTGIEASQLAGLGLLLTALGAATLLLGRRRREGDIA